MNLFMLEEIAAPYDDSGFLELEVVGEKQFLKLFLWLEVPEDSEFPLQTLLEKTPKRIFLACWEKGKSMHLAMRKEKLCHENIYPV